jgi:hypothetical protein
MYWIKRAGYANARQSQWRRIRNVRVGDHRGVGDITLAQTRHEGRARAYYEGNANDGDANDNEANDHDAKDGCNKVANSSCR